MSPFRQPEGPPHADYRVCNPSPPIIRVQLNAPHSAGQVQILAHLTQAAHWRAIWSCNVSSSHRCPGHPNEQ